MKTSVQSVLIMAVVVCAGLVLVVHRYPGVLRAQPPSEAQLEYRVDHTVRERGVVESSRSIDVRCELAGTSTILFIVPEWSRVEKGDLLVELDDSAVQNKLAEAIILVERSTSRVLQSEAELSSVRAAGTAAIGWHCATRCCFSGRTCGARAT